VSDPDYRRALDAACREWEQLAGRRTEIDNRLADLQRTIATLTRLCGYEPTVPFGLADACRLVLQRHREQALTAQAVRDELELIGLDLSKHANPLASIHVTLKRLVAGGEARFLPGGSGRPPMYAWNALPGRPRPGGRGPAAGAWAPLVGAARPVLPLGKGRRR
jgi:hypothetical protein